MGVMDSLMHLSGEDFRNLPPSQLMKMAEVYEQRAQLQRTFGKRGHFEKELASVREEIDWLKAELFPPKRRELVRQLAVRN